MSVDFILPDIGEGIVECELVEWLVKEGDSVIEDQPIADVMTDKALVQIPAMHNGTINKLYYEKGDIAKVHAPLFSMTTSTTTQENSNGSEALTAAISPESKTNASTNSFTTEDFILPDIGEGIVECELVEWLVKEGESVEEDQPVADVMTDKALVQIPAMHAGIIVKLHYAKGDIAKVHEPLFAIEIPQLIETNNPSGNIQAGHFDTHALDNINNENVETSRPGLTTHTVSVTHTENKLNNKALASPAVRRIARELNVDIKQVAGSGKKGRVYKEDIVTFCNQQPGDNNVNLAPVATQQLTVQTSSEFSSLNSNRVEPIRGIKAAMAKAMVNSVSTIPHFTYCEEIDMTALIALRYSLKESNDVKQLMDASQSKLTMMPFFMKAMSLALKQFPLVNSQVNDDCTELTYFNDHNIGMAVDSKMGLLVPNVKQVQDKSIIELAIEVSRLTQDARSGRVQASDLKSGTVTISNIGAIGGTVATPIINKPEAAIVALGRLQKLPRFNGVGEVEARQIMQVSWSGDHRIIDGGTIARFCNLWKSYLEQPNTMLIHMH